MTGQHRSTNAATGGARGATSGRHRAPQKHTGAYVWLGAGAITLGAALAGGSGVAQADTTSSVVGGPGGSHSNSAATTKIRTTLSAQTVSSSAASPTDASDGAKSTSFVSEKNSVVRQQSPAANGLPGDNNPGPGPTLAETVINGFQGDSEGLLPGVPGLDAAPNIPFIELGGGGGGLLGKLASALSGGLL